MLSPSSYRSKMTFFGERMMDVREEIFKVGSVLDEELPYQTKKSIDDLFDLHLVSDENVIPVRIYNSTHFPQLKLFYEDLKVFISYVDSVGTQTLDS